VASPLVYAVTVNWNRPGDTLECLSSLKAQTYPRLKLIAVDNGSTDSSARLISESQPDLELIASPTNLGFAGGYNAGIRQALDMGADYVFIINNDTTLHPQAIECLMKYARPEHGILAPLVYFAADPQRIWSAGGRLNRWNLEVTHRWDGQLDPGGWPAWVEQDFVTGCAMLFPRQTLQAIGLFDERFWFTYEDSDICYRVRSARRPILLVPEARIWHKVAQSSGGKGSPLERYWMARSSVLFFKKHARPYQWPVILIWRLGSAFRTTARLTLRGEFASVKAYWQGLWDALLGSTASFPGD
jgi:GT2 family glycosyltransferase